MKQSESLVIKGITVVPVQGDASKMQYIVHTNPSKLNPAKEGEKESRFKINEKVFANLARSAGKPVILFLKECIGGVYNVTMQSVKEGEAWINGGDGTYTKDHMAKVSESITLSELTIAEDLAAARSAYYSHLFGTVNTAKATPAPTATIVVDEPKDNGSDIVA